MKKISSLALLTALSVSAILPAAHAEVASSGNAPYALSLSNNSTITASKNMHYEGTFSSITENLVVKKNMIVEEGKYVAVTVYATYPKDTSLYMQLQKKNGSSWDMVQENAFFPGGKKAYTFSKLKAGTYRVQLWYNGPYPSDKKITDGTVKLDWVGE